MAKVAELVVYVTPASPVDTGSILYERFKAEQDLLVIPVLDESGCPVGILERNAFFLKMAGEYGRLIFGRRPITAVMNPDPVIVQADTPAAEFTEKTLSDRPSDLLGGFIVMDGERYAGVGTALSLLQTVSSSNRTALDQLAASAARLAHLAHFDPLTQSPNRSLFHKNLNDALARNERSGERLAVHCIDLDHFKTVNDTLGHPVGDALLQAVAMRLRGCVREIDTLARLGGDEFAIVQVGNPDETAAAILAERVVRAIAEPFEVAGHQMIIGASVGLVLSSSRESSGDELLQKADMALYRAKGEGRGAFRFFEAGMDERLKARRALEMDLRRALQRGEFTLHYQPLLNLKANKVSGCEALVRWNHPTRGMISPIEFISLAEETGLVGPMGDWVLRQACREAANWPKDVRVAVNISPVQFRASNLLAIVKSALSASGLPANRLELEITESVLLNDSDENLQTLHRLRDLGVRISMDDFGTGYSSLSYLRSFPFDKIKIDQSFIADLPNDAGAMAIIQAVMGLGASLGMTTTAEGVETQRQLDELRAQGCDEIQGYLISRPVPLSEIEALFAKQHPASGKAAKASKTAKVA